MCKTNSRRRSQTWYVAARLLVISVFLLPALTMICSSKLSRQRHTKMGDATTTTVEQQPRFAVTSSLWSDHLRYTRHDFLWLVCSSIYTFGPTSLLSTFIDQLSSCLLLTFSSYISICCLHIISFDIILWSIMHSNKASMLRNISFIIWKQFFTMRRPLYFDIIFEIVDVSPPEIITIVIVPDTLSHVS